MTGLPRTSPAIALRVLSKTAAVVCAFVFTCTIADADASDGPDLRFNQVQVIGTHNSYHQAPTAAVMALIGPELSKGLDYTHPPLAEQFANRGIRQIELDLYADPKGGHFAHPLATRLLKETGKDSGENDDPGGLMSKPGLKVIHVPDIDFRTTALTLEIALRQVRVWSKANPAHLPILILLELKEESGPGLIKPLPFDDESLGSVDSTILSVFSRDEILTPDDVRGNSKTLAEAIQTRGWPALSAVRGRVVFALDNEDAIRDRYLAGHENLHGRLMLTSVKEGHPAACWFKINDPVRDFDRIRRLVKQGFLVRTRADANTTQARTGDTRMRDQALASGAQFVSTDYPAADPRFSEYRVGFAGGVTARPNPVSASAVQATETFDLEIGKSP